MNRHSDLDSWNRIYDLWLIKGELRHLIRIRKIRRYLEHGRLKTDQEYDNLIAQLLALLELHNYSGSAASTLWPRTDVTQSTVDTVLRLMKPSQHIQLPDLYDTDSVAEFLENRLDIRIKPQPTEHYPTHPLWILWHSFTVDVHDHNHCTALWLYREILMHYMHIGDYKKAARVLGYASDIKISIEPLPLLHPYVIKKVMYVNLH